MQPYQQYMYSYPHKTAYGPLYNVDLKDYAGSLAGGNNSLYFHIPFCQHKCGYCNLFSAAGQTEQRMREYVDAMERQSAQFSAAMPAGVEFSDLTLGGGTPLILPVPLLRRVFALAERYFGFEPEGHSVVIETSPNQTTEEKLVLLKQMGVSRISIGVQSFQEPELAALGRFHSGAAAKRALQLIRKMDFACVNVDLIYGIEGQTIDSLLDSLRQAVEFEPEELFVYPLYVQPGTSLYRQGAGRSRQAPEMYRHAREFLREAGYQPCSMRRFVRQAQAGCPGAAMDGELPALLCGFGNTVSVGCGGRSYIGRLHFCTPYAVGQEQCLSIMKEYMEREDDLKITHGFLLTPEEEKRRYVIRHILFGRGVDCGDYRKHFGKELLDEFPQIREWIAGGYAAGDRGFITLTEEGFALSDFLGPQLISDAVRERSDRFYKRLPGR